MCKASLVVVAGGLAASFEVRDLMEEGFGQFPMTIILVNGWPGGARSRAWLPELVVSLDGGIEYESTLHKYVL